MIKTTDDINFAGKSVLIRCDYNVPVVNGMISDKEDDKIEFSLNTIRKVVDDGAKFIMLVSHLGRPNGKFDERFSLNPVKWRLENYLKEKIILIERLEDIQKFKNDPFVKIVILENIRFWKEEESSDEVFAHNIASDFDVYINNAFSVCHRDHASLTKFPKFCAEKCVGDLLLKEFKSLSKAKKDPVKPAVAIIGGSKIETKLPVIKNLAKEYDFVLIGGKTANEALDKKIDFPENVILPVDFIPIESVDRLDIGEKTQKIFIDKINKAKTIVWNGPLGMFEKEEYAIGTKEIAKAIVSNKKAFKLVGGGETIAAVNYFVDVADFDYVSMSGGAMLDFLAEKEMPGLKALED